MTEKTALKWRHRIQANAERLQPDSPLPDQQTESDELFQNAGEKGREHLDPDDPPRRRANKRRGRGIYANDRPPVLGTVGRETGLIRLRVVKDTTIKTLTEHVHHLTREGTQLYTDEYESYDHIDRPRSTVCHGLKEWARDDDGDGLREVHTNSAEGMWSGLRFFLHPYPPFSCTGFAVFIKTSSAATLPFMNSVST
jgi:hypothetical protein